MKSFLEALQTDWSLMEPGYFGIQYGDVEVVFQPLMWGQCLWLDDEEDAEQHRIRAAMHLKAAALLDALEADARKEEDDG